MDGGGEGGEGGGEGGLRSSQCLSLSRRTPYYCGSEAVSCLSIMCHGARRPSSDGSLHRSRLF